MSILPTKKPKVSIGLPVYNGEIYLEDALCQILGQTFIDFELIISDNCSTDKTAEICRKYELLDNRIRYIRQPINKGSVANFNFVLDEAIGDYFMFAAYDDCRSSFFIEKLVNALIDTDSVSAFCICNEIDETGVVINRGVTFNYTDSLSFIRATKYILDLRHLRDIPIYGIHKREVISKFRVSQWRWFNTTNPTNLAHPVMLYILSSGNFYLYNDEVLFSRRVVKNQPWKKDVIFKSSAENYIKDIILKIQLFIRSVNAIYLGSGSIIVIFLILPALMLVLVHDILRQSIVPITVRVKNYIFNIRKIQK